MLDKPKLDLGVLEEDDEFEEFPVEDWTSKDKEEQDISVWEDNWEDDNIEDDFNKQLSAERAKVKRMAELTKAAEILAASQKPKTPKKLRNPFFIFLRDFRIRSPGPMSAQRAGRAWRNMEGFEKEPYFEQARSAAKKKSKAKLAQLEKQKTKAPSK